MAFAFTNRTPFGSGTIPLTRITLADQTADVAAQDMGVAGLKFLKIRMLIKAQVGTFALRVNVSPVVGMTTPEYIIQSATYADGEPITAEWTGWSDAGFQFVNLDVTLGTSATFDVELEAW
jgi:hypothetical protein